MKLRVAIIVGAILIFSGLMVISPAIAAPNENANERAKSGPVVSIPENAVQISDHVYYLGKSKDVDGTVVEGFAFVFRANEHAAKPPGTPGKGPSDKNGDGEVECFEYIGGKWNPGTEGWLFDTKNTQGMNEAKLFTDFSDDIQDWEDEAGTSGVDILQDGTNVSNVGFTVGNDGLNQIFFGDVNSEGAIAVTFTWTTVGKPSLREIRAFDMVFDQVDFAWSNKAVTPTANTMDFNNIAMHELGHSIGMAHPKDDSCTEETMWGSAANEETKKRTLNSGDIEGITQLYA